MKLLPIGLLLSGLMSTGAEARDVDFCLAKDKHWSTAEHMSRMKELGVSCATVYYSLNTPANLAAPYIWVQEYLDYDYKVIMVLRIDADGANPLRQTLHRNNDRALDDLIYEMTMDRRPITIRIWHESDGNWYPWQMYYPGNSIPLLVRGFEYVVNKFVQAKALSFVSIESNFNRRDAPTDTPLSEGELYMPQIDAVVNSHSFSTYNRCGSRDKYRPPGVGPGVDSPELLEYEKTFAEEADPFYERVSTFTDRPVNIAEVSTSGLCTNGKKIPWFRELLKVVDTQYKRVETITFTFGSVAIGEASNDVEILWGLDSEDQRVEFAALLNEYRRKWEMEEVIPLTSFEQTGGFDLSFGADETPWSMWVKIGIPIQEVPNNSINSVSGESFGKVGPVFQAVLKQRWLKRTDYGFKFGPGINFATAQSNNSDQWWFNHVQLGVTLGLYSPVPRGKQIRWGSFSAELYGNFRRYTTDEIPNRLEGWVPAVGVKFEMNVGGNWVK